MNNAGDLFESAINNWRNKGGRGTALIPYPLNNKLMMLSILQRMYSHTPNIKTLIVTNDFRERANIIEYLTKQEDEEENNKEFKDLLDKGNIKILTSDFVAKNRISYFLNLCIIYCPKEIDDSIVKLLLASKFKLVILTRLIQSNAELVDLYKVAPLLEDFKQHEVEAVRLSTPVEEMQVSINIPNTDEEYKLLTYYNEFIATSITIFGDFGTINNINKGDDVHNISSNQLCLNLAYSNGWNEHLDMSIEFNQELDKLYNPLALKDRASRTYEMIRNRSQLLSDYKGKLDAILKIVNDNKDAKILIINKRGEFANIVTNFINTYSETDICGNYHDKVESIPAIDVEGNPIYYKSGVNKGERRLMASKAQKSLNEQRFNLNKIRVLSTNNSPDKDLDIDVDIIIITSPMCEDIKSYIYRLSGLRFNNRLVKLYTIYCKNTMEDKLLQDKERLVNHNVKNLNDDENNADFIIVD